MRGFFFLTALVGELIAVVALFEVIISIIVVAVEFLVASIVPTELVL